MLGFDAMSKMNSRLVSPDRMGQAFINISQCRYNGVFPLEVAGFETVVLVLTGAIRLI
jgi:hypothetical protein